VASDVRQSTTARAVVRRELCRDFPAQVAGRVRMRPGNGQREHSRNTHKHWPGADCKTETGERHRDRMLAKRRKKFSPITNERSGADCDQKNNEVGFIKKSEACEQTKREREPDLSVLVPPDRKIKTGASANKARHCDAPIESRNEKISGIERE